MRVVPNRISLARLGISVSLRVSPKAVTRNRIKRQVREAFRRQQHELTGLDLVVVAQPGAGAGDNAALRASLQQHLTHIAQKCKSS